MFPHRYGKDWTEQIVNSPRSFSSGYLFQGVPRIQLITLTPKVFNDLSEIKGQVKASAFDLHLLRTVAEAKSQVLRRLAAGVLAVTDVLPELEISGI
jgi:hypothetical protein